MHFRKILLRAIHGFGIILAAVILLSLIGCAIPTKYVRELPPAELLQDCHKPEYDKSTNKGLAEGLIRYDEALALCSNDKRALRNWAQEK